jgi:hypothetical protein
MRYNDECKKPKSYGRRMFIGEKECRSKGGRGCEQFGVLWYEGCRKGFVEVFKVCVAGCGEGWTDNGEGCRWEDNFSVRTFSWNLGD